ncbi:MAG: hypothetical protein GYA51_01760 [Candidatus Methanofastidiosa archaeon]|jgi:hypothetical protein|nr:hypothetical protein [Candidatus Methanofastidiosa archaeon]
MLVSLGIREEYSEAECDSIEILKREISSRRHDIIEEHCLLECDEISG